MEDPILWTPWRMPYLRGEQSSQHTYEGCVLCAKPTLDDDTEFVVARSEFVYVILNLYPYNNGHLMVVPYAHVPSLEALPPDALTDLMLTLNKALGALRRVYQPRAFNIGANIGAEAGAGIPDHFHLHVVPRWDADTGYMTVIGGARVIPDLLENTYRELKKAWQG